MDGIAHALFRSVIHFFAAIGIVHAIYRGEGTLWRRKPEWRDWIPGTTLKQFLAAGCLTLFFAFIREPFDVAHGQSLWKAYLADLPSWTAGIVVAIWDGVRLIKERYRSEQYPEGDPNT